MAARSTCSGESDIIIAAEHATFFDPHVTYGMVAGFESVHLLQKLPLGETLRVMLLGAHERMSAERAHQLGLVSEVVPSAELLERAMWVARAIASAPVMPIQGTVRAVWMAHELTRREALAQVSTFVALGTQFDNIAEGQETFQGARARVAAPLRVVWPGMLARRRSCRDDSDAGASSRSTSRQVRAARRLRRDRREPGRSRPS